MMRKLIIKLMKFIPVKDGDNDEEFAVDDEGDIKAFEER